MAMNDYDTLIFRRGKLELAYPTQRQLLDYAISLEDKIVNLAGEQQVVGDCGVEIHYDHFGMKTHVEYIGTIGEYAVRRCAVCAHTWTEKNVVLG